MTRLLHRAWRNARRGVTLVELLVVLLILSLLATIATPVFVNRIAEARLATARAEVESIASAEQFCALNHGVYLPLQILDDLPLPEAGVSGPSGRDDVENSVAGGSVFLINYTASAIAQDGSQIDLGNFNTDPLANRVYFGWKGPYINYNRFYTTGDGDPAYDPRNDADARFDYPLDPWGNPYRFYSPLGLIGTSANDDTPPYSNDFSNGDLTTTNQRFDRYAVVSLGPNGLFGDTGTGGTEIGDNVVYVFGFDPNESTFSF